MAFSSIDGGGHAAPRPRQQPTSNPFDGLAGAIAKAAPAAVANPGATTDQNKTAFGSIPGVTDGGSGTTFDFIPGTVTDYPSDGGVDSFNPNVGQIDLGGLTPPPAPSTPPPIDINAILQKALAQMGFSQLDNSLQRQREQLIERFGDPSLASLAGFGLDPQAGAFAQQNYLSGNADLARLDKQKKQSQQAVINRLASHGLLFSGDLGHGLNETESQYGNSRYDLTQSYLQQLQALLDNTLQQKQALRSNVVNALLSSFGNQIQDPSQLIGLYGNG